MDDVKSLAETLDIALAGVERMRRINELALLIQLVILLRQGIASGVLTKEEEEIFTKLLEGIDAHLRKVVGLEGEE